MPAMHPLDALTFNPVGAHVATTDLTSSLAVAVPDTATKLLAQADGGNIRYTLGGTTPTAALGFVLKDDNDPIVIPVGGDTVFKFIEEAAAGGALLQYQFGN